MPFCKETFYQDMIINQRTILDGKTDKSIKQVE